VETAPEIPPDETGVAIDGGNRIAVGADGLGGVMESDVELPLENGGEHENAPNRDDGNNAEINERSVNDQPNETEGDNRNDGDADRAQPSYNEIEQAEPSQMSEEDLAVLYSTDSFEQSEERGAEDDSAEQESDYEHNQPRETNPARLLAAE
jgi:hypothetical protein